MCFETSSFEIYRSPTVALIAIVRALVLSKFTPFRTRASTYVYNTSAYMNTVSTLS